MRKRVTTDVGIQVALGALAKVVDVRLTGGGD